MQNHHDEAQYESQDAKAFDAHVINLPTLTRQGMLFNTKCKMDAQVLHMIRKRMLDNFNFANSSLVCSLEHFLLSKCFEQGQDSCTKEAQQYGSCLYRRFDGAINVLSCGYCKYDYQMFTMCHKLVRAANQFVYSDHEKVQHYESSSHDEDDALCRDMFASYMHCLSQRIYVHYADPGYALRKFV